MAARFSKNGHRIGRPPLPLGQKGAWEQKRLLERRTLVLRSFDIFCRQQQTRILRAFHGHEPDYATTFTTGPDPRTPVEADAFDWLKAQQRYMRLGEGLSVVDRQDGTVQVECRQ